MCAEAHQLTHTSIHRPHLCTDTHSGRRVFAHAQCHAHSHTFTHAVCVCAEACATTVANDCAHARSLTHVHARTQTHSSGLQRVGCSALSVREGCLWQAHTHTCTKTHTLTDTKTDIQTRTHTHRAPESTVRQSARSERVQAAQGPGTVKTAGTSALGGEGQPFPSRAGGYMEPKIL